MKLIGKIPHSVYSCLEVEGFGEGEGCERVSMVPFIATDSLVAFSELETEHGCGRRACRVGEGRKFWMWEIMKVSPEASDEGDQGKIPASHN